MAEKVKGISGKVLKWAREQASMSINDVAEKLKKDTDIIKAWENDLDTPTYFQLEQLAYTYYKKPLAMFFLPEPPVDKFSEPDFRLVPEASKLEFGRNMKLVIHKMMGFQESIRELSNGINDSEKKVFEDFSLNKKSDFENQCSKIREYIGISVKEQLSWKNSDEALKAWRDAVESCGIYVIKHGFRNDNVSGFCLIDPDFPIICLNNSTSRNRQIFTIFHELAHILTQSGGMTFLEQGYLNSLSKNEKQLEILCNRFAANLLVPDKELSKLRFHDFKNDITIQEIADNFSVSREVILRRLVDIGLVDEAYYAKKREEWLHEWRKFKQDQRETSGTGGDYHATQKSYLGNRLLKLGFSSYYSGKITLQELATYFDMKTKSLPKLATMYLGAS